MVENAVEVIEVGLDAELVDERRHPLGADRRRAEHGPQVAVEKLGGARVDEQQLPEVVAHRPPVDQLHHGQADALVPDLGGLGIVGAGEAAADVGLVRPVAAEAGKPAAIGSDEDRTGDHPVGQMVAARDVGVREDEHVLRIDPASEILAAVPAPQSRRHRYGSECRRRWRRACRRGR